MRRRSHVQPSYLVEAIHERVGLPGLQPEPPGGRTHGIAGLVYGSVRGVTRVLGGSIEALLGQIVPLPAGVECHALAATSGRRNGDDVDRFLGGGLVPLASALGRHPERKAPQGPVGRGAGAGRQGHFQTGGRFARNAASPSR